MVVYVRHVTARHSMARVVTRAMAAALMTLASQSTAQERALEAGQHDPTNVVVAIVSRLGDTDVFGGGLISGYKDGRVYIATANHIVRRGPDQAAHIEIVIKRLPERRIKAILLERFDHGLDLAVLAISVRDADVLDPTRLPQGFARDAQLVSHGEALYSIGHPSGQLWRKSVTPDRFADVVGDGVRFESLSLAPGHSGGALVNSDGEIIGMIRRDEPPTGVASNIHTLMRKFSEWGYPVSSWAFPVDIGGNWVGSVSQQPGTPSSSWPDEKKEFHFAYDGRQITGGTTSMSHNTRNKITSGKIRGNFITFQIEGQIRVQQTDGRECPIVETYAGEVQGDSLRGDLTVTRGTPCQGVYARRSFVAKRR